MVVKNSFVELARLDHLHPAGAFNDINLALIFVRVAFARSVRAA
jgi:hypothetical protein